MRSTEEPDPYGENPPSRLPELAGRVVYLVGFSEHENRPAERTISDFGLDTQAMADRSRRGELHQVHLDVRETLQRLLEGAIAPEWGQKRAAAPSAGANRVPPAL